MRIENDIVAKSEQKARDVKDWESDNIGDWGSIPIITACQGTGSRDIGNRGPRNAHGAKVVLTIK